MPRWERAAYAKWKLGHRLRRAERQCVLKKPQTEETAMLEAERQRRNGDVNVRGYRCDHCGEWHVGRVPRL